MNDKGSYFSSKPSNRGGSTSKRNYYDEESPVEAREISRCQDDNQIILYGKNIPEPIFSFDSVSLPDFIKNSLMEEGYVKPTTIQSQAWPIVLNGRDMVGIAQTGSGKTLAYVLPALLSFSRPNNKGKSSEDSSLQVVVLAPTRELALQIHQVVSKFAGKELRSVCVYGGAPKGRQLNELSQGCNICIATPGRLNDFLDAGSIDISSCRFLVLDEADRMLDMGFEPQVRKVLSYANYGQRCQMLMWSATWPKQVEQLAQEFLHNYIHITVGSGSGGLAANHDIIQVVVVCDEEDKMDKLLEFLSDTWNNEGQGEMSPKTIIFAQTKRKVEELTRSIKRQGYTAVAIHGDKTQIDREWILDAFTKGHYSLMVATDVAGRGIDVGDVQYVINYDYPNSSEEYVHRIGRTGRSGKIGTAITLFTAKNARHAKELVDVLEEANQPVSNSLMELVNSRGRFKGAVNNRNKYHTNTSYEGYDGFVGFGFKHH